MADTLTAPELAQDACSIWPPGCCFLLLVLGKILASLPNPLASLPGPVVRYRTSIGHFFTVAKHGC
jgi:hypothetical protein